MGQKWVHLRCEAIVFLLLLATILREIVAVQDKQMCEAIDLVQEPLSQELTAIRV